MLHLIGYHRTLNNTFGERGDLAVNSEKEENWLYILGKIGIGCQFEERTNQVDYQPSTIIHVTPTSYTSLSTDSLAFQHCRQAKDCL